MIEILWEGSSIAIVGREELASLEQELADVLQVAIARGVRLGYFEADGDYRARLKVLIGGDDVEVK